MSSILLLHVSLKDSKPSIWRRIAVDGKRNFYELHHIIQIAMGWENYHLFDFKLGELVIGSQDEESSSLAIDADQAILEKLLVEKGVTFEYTYDYGDNWVHEIVVEEIYPKKRGDITLSCISGERSCPPEDCGGLHGYYQNLEILRDTKHPQYRETREWMGKDFDATAFNVGQVNRQLGSLAGYIRKWEKGMN